MAEEFPAFFFVLILEYLHGSKHKTIVEYTVKAPSHHHPLRWSPPAQLLGNLASSLWLKQVFIFLFSFSSSKSSFGVYMRSAWKVNFPFSEFYSLWGHLRCFCSRVLCWVHILWFIQPSSHWWGLGLSRVLLFQTSRQWAALCFWGFSVFEGVFWGRLLAVGKLNLSSVSLPGERWLPTLMWSICFQSHQVSAAAPGLLVFVSANGIFAVSWA